VHDLRAQARPFRLHALLEAAERATHQLAPRRVVDLLEQRPQPRRSADVPEQLAAGGRMEERPEREAEAGLHGGDPGHRGVGELRAGFVALPPFEEPHLMAVEGGARCERPGYRQLRVDGRDMRDRRLLEVEDCRGFAAVRDLEHTAGTPVVEEESLVALAAQVAGVGVDSEQLCRDLRSLGGGEPRRRRLQNRTHG
jgi:hypothetical protein